MKVDWTRSTTAPAVPCAAPARPISCTNNPKKIVGLESYGLNIVERVPIVVESNPENHDYLRTKQDKMGHLLGPLGAESHS